MNPEVKQRWLEALRSGRYEQGREYLHYTQNGERYFCCLGVLMDIELNFWETADEGEKTIYGMGGAIQFPGEGLKRRAGLTDQDCKVLTQLNDSMSDGVHLYDFKDIADYIERAL